MLKKIVMTTLRGGGIGICALFSFAFKWLRRTLYLCAAIIALAAIAIFFADDVIRFAINHSANYVDLNAKVDEVDLHLITQRIVLRNITLKNPDGFQDKDALVASTISFKFDIFDAKNPIKRIYLQNAKIRVEGRSGRRIMAQTFFKSNIYVIARELSRAFDVKLEKLIFASRKKSKESDETLDYAKIRQKLEHLDGIDEVRLENVTIENGDDTYTFGSVSCNERVVSLSDFSATVFGVKFRLRNAFCDIQKPLFGFSGFSVRNPDGFPKNSVFSIKRFLLTMKDVKDANGNIVPRLDSLDIDSPTVYFEDSKGSMLGAFGMENNFAGLYNTVSSMTRAKLGDLFQDEFGSAPRSQEFKLPEINWDNINITNARIVSSKKDAGLLANKIHIGKNKIDIDDIRAHIGGLKLELDGVVFDSQKQLFIASDFILRNPAGFPEESAFRFKNFLMSTNFKESVLRGNRVMSIDRIEVNKFFVRLDSRSGDLIDLIGNDNNLYALLDSISETTKAMPVYSAEAEKKINEDKTKRPYKFIIKSVKFCDGKIFIGPRGDSIKIPFKDVVQSDLGVEEKGLTSQGITTLLLKEIILNSIDGAESKVSEEIGGVFLAPIITVLRTLITIF